MPPTYSAQAFECPNFPTVTIFVIVNKQARYCYYILNHKFCKNRSKLLNYKFNFQILTILYSIRWYFNKGKTLFYNLTLYSKFSEERPIHSQ